MQDPSSSSDPKGSFPNQPSPFRSSHHRRAHSEVNFRLPEDLDLASDPFDAPSGSFEDVGSEDDIFSTYMDIEKLGSNLNEGGLDCPIENAAELDKSSRPRHRHSNSVDSSSAYSDSIEAKKAMAPEKLAELWTLDPKRAKRILANRQSAARSKERKARYIIELERKVQTLQTEATTLSAQLTLFQRDTTGLSSENSELKIRLQAMEQQAHLRDALNEALKQEVERMRVETGEIASNNSDAYDMGMHHVHYNNQSSFFSNQSLSSRQMMQQQQQQQQQQQRFDNFQSNNNLAHQHRMITGAQDPIGCFQGLDIKSEGPSASSASESSAAGFS